MDHTKCKILTTHNLANERAAMKLGAIDCLWKFSFSAISVKLTSWFLFTLAGRKFLY